MPDNLSSILRVIVVNWGVPFALVFWYACRVRHPARSRFRAFLMALAVVAVVPPAVLGGLYYYVVNNEGSPFLAVPAVLALPFALRALHPRVAWPPIPAEAWDALDPRCLPYQAPGPGTVRPPGQA